MKRQDHMFLREVFARLATRNNLKDAETSATYQLLISYASTEQGATHLKEIHVLDELVKSECLAKLREQDLYITTQASGALVQVRNPAHLQWCQVLVLLRTLN